MNPNKALWEKGDFTQIAATMRDSGEELVQDFGVTSGMEGLDLGCGDGTTAVPTAKLGANVLGVTLRATSSPPAMRARHRQVLPICGSRKVTHRTSATSRTGGLIWS